MRPARRQPSEEPAQLRWAGFISAWTSSDALSPDTIEILRQAWKIRKTGENFDEYLAEFERKKADLFQKAGWKDWEEFHNRED